MVLPKSDIDLCRKGRRTRKVDVLCVAYPAAARSAIEHRVRFRCPGSDVQSRVAADADPRVHPVMLRTKRVAEDRVRKAHSTRSRQRYWDAHVESTERLRALLGIRRLGLKSDSISTLTAAAYGRCYVAEAGNASARQKTRVKTYFMRFPLLIVSLLLAIAAQR